MNGSNKDNTMTYCDQVVLGAGHTAVNKTNTGPKSQPCVPLIGSWQLAVEAETQ